MALAPPAASIVRMRIAQWLLVALSWAAAASAAAASFQVLPTLVEVPPDASVASLTIRNPGTEPLSIQIDAQAWSQGVSGEVRTDTGDLVVVPRIAVIAPGAAQIVRMALRNQDRSREHAFRARFREIPPPAPPGFLGVRTALEIDLPVFFSVQEAAADLHWRASRTPEGLLELHAENRGNRFVRLVALQAVDARGAVLAEGRPPLYVLGGSTTRIPLTTHARLAQGDPVRLQIDLGGDRQEHALTVE